jgi:maleamate amidohydrolase
MSGALTANYAGAFDGHLPFGTRPALLIIDVVQAYVTPGSTLYAGADGVVPCITRLRAAMDAAGLPVLFTTVAYTAGGLDGGLFYRKVPALKLFDPGSPLAAYPPELSPSSTDVVVTKQYASAFFGTSLASTLTALRCDCVFVTGFSTSGCVRATALDALQHGFAPFVVREGCGDRHPAPHEANLFDLQAKYAEVVSEGEARALIQGVSAR